MSTDIDTNHESCGHNFDDHVLMAGKDGPMAGGLMFCPVEGCACETTWGPNGTVPTQETIEELRGVWASYQET